MNVYPIFQRPPENSFDLFQDPRGSYFVKEPKGRHGLQSRQVYPLSSGSMYTVPIPPPPYITCQGTYPLPIHPPVMLQHQFQPGPPVLRKNSPKTCHPNLNPAVLHHNQFQQGLPVLRKNSPKACHPNLNPAVLHHNQFQQGLPVLRKNSPKACYHHPSPQASQEIQVQQNLFMKENRCQPPFLPQVNSIEYDLLQQIERPNTPIMPFHYHSQSSLFGHSSEREDSPIPYSSRTPSPVTIRNLIHHNQFQPAPPVLRKNSPKACHHHPNPQASQETQVQQNLSMKENRCQALFLPQVNPIEYDPLQQVERPSTPIMPFHYHSQSSLFGHSSERGDSPIPYSSRTPSPVTIRNLIHFSENQKTPSPAYPELHLDFLLDHQPGSKPHLFSSDSSWQTYPL
jgi:hypothetical protein